MPHPAVKNRLLVSAMVLYRLEAVKVTPAVWLESVETLNSQVQPGGISSYMPHAVTRLADHEKRENDIHNFPYIHLSFASLQLRWW